MEHWYIPYSADKYPSKGNILVLAPHPDDEVFGCGGAIMRHIKQGDAVHVVLLTDGDAAIPHANEAARGRYIEERRQESLQAAHILGYHNLSYWHIADRALQFTPALVQRLYDLIQTLDISRVYACSLLEIHPDHYALAQIALAAVQRCGAAVELAMYEVGVPLHPNLLLDITDLKARKRMAINCFKSQLILQNYRQQMEALNVYRAYTLPKTITAAEAYYVQTGAVLTAQPSLHYGQTRQSQLLAAIQTQVDALQQQLNAVQNSN